MAITEAARAAEVLLGPYTGEEHSKCVTVVRDCRLNRAYTPSIRLFERTDLDAGNKKHARAAEISGPGPITVVPLHAAGPCDASGPSEVVEDADRPAKRLAMAVGREGSLSSSSSSSGDHSDSADEGASEGVVGAPRRRCRR